MRNQITIILSIFHMSAHSEATSHDWRYSVAASVTRCFETSEVHTQCEDLTGEGETIAREELEISAKDFKGQEYVYSYNKGIEGSLCQEHLKGIRKLLRGTNQVCITGDDETKFPAGEINLRWTGLETRRGEILR